MSSLMVLCETEIFFQAISFQLSIKPEVFQQFLSKAYPNINSIPLSSVLKIMHDLDGEEKYSLKLDTLHMGLRKFIMDSSFQRLWCEDFENKLLGDKNERLDFHQLLRFWLARRLEVNYGEVFYMEREFVKDMEQRNNHLKSIEHFIIPLIFDMNSYQMVKVEQAIEQFGLALSEMTKLNNEIDRTTSLNSGVCRLNQLFINSLKATEFTKESIKQSNSIVIDLINQHLIKEIIEDSINTYNNEHLYLANSLIFLTLWTIANQQSQVKTSPFTYTNVFHIILSQNILDSEFQQNRFQALCHLSALYFINIQVKYDSNLRYYNFIIFLKRELIFQQHYIVQWLVLVQKLQSLQDSYFLCQYHNMALINLINYSMKLDDINPFRISVIHSYLQYISLNYQKFIRDDLFVFIIIHFFGLVIELGPEEQIVKQILNALVMMICKIKFQRKVLESLCVMIKRTSNHEVLQLIQNAFSNDLWQIYKQNDGNNYLIFEVIYQLLLKQVELEYKLYQIAFTDQQPNYMIKKLQSKCLLTALNNGGKRYLNLQKDELFYQIEQLLESTQFQDDVYQQVYNINFTIYDCELFKDLITILYILIEEDFIKDNHQNIQMDNIVYQIQSQNKKFISVNLDKAIQNNLKFIFNNSAYNKFLVGKIEQFDKSTFEIIEIVLRYYAKSENPKSVNNLRSLRSKMLQLAGEIKQNYKLIKKIENTLSFEVEVVYKISDFILPQKRIYKLNIFTKYEHLKAQIRQDVGDFDQREKIQMVFIQKYSEIYLCSQSDLDKVIQYQVRSFAQFDQTECYIQVSEGARQSKTSQCVLCGDSFPIIRSIQTCENCYPKLKKQLRFTNQMQVATQLDYSQIKIRGYSTPQRSSSVFKMTNSEIIARTPNEFFTQDKITRKQLQFS